jgi:hypothetical protein
MSSPEKVFELGVFLAGLARGLAHQQLRLNEEHATQLREFQPVLRLAKELGYEAEARAVAPRLMVVEQAEVGVRVHLAASREQEFAVGVRMINLRYSRRYKYSQFVENSVQLTVQSVPLIQTPGR